ncbi:MAG TPA: YcxB family protein [Candidatus Sulfotelmatobacter sp.]|nr:YcxB family protein [Candidatus Sulfotelmatobacter sp.]
MDGLAQKLAKEAGMMAAVSTAQDANDLNGLDPREVVELRFFLRPEELDEATAIRKCISNTIGNKAPRRLIFGMGAVFAGFMPYLIGTNWAAWWQRHPGTAIFWMGMLILNVYVLLEQPGMKQLNRFLNRLDVERRICVSHRGIDIRHGRLRRQNPWTDFSFYQETPTILLLQTTGPSFWTLPKRAIPAGREDQLQTLLKAKLQRR